MTTKIVLHIPHASTQGLDQATWHDSTLLAQSVHELTDWYTDELFILPHPQIQAIQARLSRFVVDCERLINDPMEQQGQGIIYTHHNGNKRSVSPLEQQSLMQHYHHHINSLKQALRPDSLLIDCHSFPSHMADIDICIGFNDDWSKPSAELLQMVYHTFSSQGYSVAFNSPYSNSVAPQVAGFTYPSLMIEVNKRCYIDEATLAKKASFTKLQHIIHTLYINILNN